MMHMPPVLTISVCQAFVAMGKGILTRLTTVLVVDGSVVFLGGGGGGGDLDDGLHFGF